MPREIDFNPFGDDEPIIKPPKVPVEDALAVQDYLARSTGLGGMPEPTNNPFAAFAPNEALTARQPPDPRGVLGGSFGMLTPEESEADLQGRRDAYNAAQNQIAQLERMRDLPINQGRRVGLQSQIDARKTALPDLDQIAKMEQGFAPMATKTALRSGVENVVTGAGDVAISVPKMAGIIKGYLGGNVDDDSILAWSRGAEGWLRSQFPGDPARAQDFSQQLASGLGQIGVFYGAGAVSALLKAGPAATAAVVASLGSTTTGASGFEEGTTELAAARNKAKAEGRTADVTEYDRLLKTIGYSAIGVTEAIPVAKTISRVAPNPATSLGNRLIQTAEGAVEEALQESGSQLAQNLTTQQTTDPARGTTEGVAESGAVGGVLGGLMNFLLPGRFSPNLDAPSALSGTTVAAPGGLPTGPVPGEIDRGDLQVVEPGADLPVGDTPKTGAATRLLPPPATSGSGDNRSTGEAAAPTDGASGALRQEVEKQVRANPGLAPQMASIITRFDDNPELVAASARELAETGKLSGVANRLVLSLQKMPVQQFGTTQDRVLMRPGADPRPTATVMPPEGAVEMADELDVLFGAGGAAASESTDRDPLGYYSKALEAAKGLKQPRGTTEQMLAQLRSAGVKENEIKATGLEEWLASRVQPGQNTLPMVTKQELVDFLDQNRVRLKESRYGAGQLGLRIADVLEKEAGKIGTILGGRKAREKRDALLYSAKKFREGEYSPKAALDFADIKPLLPYELELAIGEAKPAKWKQYSLDPSNPTYEENVLHLGGKEVIQAKYQPQKDALMAEARTRPSEERLRQINQDLYDIDTKINQEHRDSWRAGHWPEDNIVAHLRTQELQTTDGRRALNLDELQSDEAQAIREQGVRSPERTVQVQARIDSLEGQVNDLLTEGTSPLSIAYKIATEANSEYASAALANGRLMDGESILYSDYYGFESDIRAAMRAYDPELARLWAAKEAADAEHTRILAELYQELPGVDYVQNDPRYRASYRKNRDSEGAVVARYNTLMENDPARLLLAEIETERGKLSQGRKGHPLINTTDQWVTTAMRRLIQKAVDSGVDGITITPAKVQNQRFRLSNVIDSAFVNLEMEAGRRQINFRNQGGRNVVGSVVVDPDGTVFNASETIPGAKGQPLSAVVGPHAAAKLMAAADGDIVPVEEMEVGGEGMRATYEGIYPRTLLKLLQKMDKTIKPEKTRVWPSTMTGGTRASHDAVFTGTDKFSQDFFFVPITDKVRETLVEEGEGQPLFALGGKLDDQSIVETLVVGSQLAQNWQQAMAQHYGRRSWPGPDAALATLNRMAQSHAADPAVLKQMLREDGFGRVPAPLLGQGLLAAQALRVAYESPGDVLAALRGFYNPVIRAVEEAKQDRATAGQWKSLLQGPGVRQELVNWTGVMEWLDEQGALRADRPGSNTPKTDKTISKQELLDFLNSHDFEIEETTLLSEGTPEWNAEQQRIADAENALRLEQWQANREGRLAELQQEPEPEEDEESDPYEDMPSDRDRTEEIREAAEEIYDELRDEAHGEEMNAWDEANNPRHFDVQVHHIMSPVDKAIYDEADRKYREALREWRIGLSGQLALPGMGGIGNMPTLEDFLPEDFEFDEPPFYFVIDKPSGNEGGDYDSGDNDEYFDTAEEAQAAGLAYVEEQTDGYDRRYENQSESTWQQDFAEQWSDALQQAEQAWDAEHPDFVAEEDRDDTPEMRRERTRRERARAMQDLSRPPTPVEPKRWSDQTKFGRYKIEGGQQYKELIIRLPMLQRAGYESPHFHTNEVVHIRFDIRKGPNGEQVLFIHEIQSDLHQRARGFGYGQEGLDRARKVLIENGFTQETGDAYVNLNRQVEEIYRQANDLRDPQAMLPEANYAAHEALMQQAGQLNARLTEIKNAAEKLGAAAARYIGNFEKTRGAPEAPFKGSAWWELAFKAALQHAVEVGADAVALTNPAQVSQATYTPKDVAQKFYGENVPRYIDKYMKKWGVKREGKPVSGTEQANYIEYSHDFDRDKTIKFFKDVVDKTAYKKEVADFLDFVDRTNPDSAGLLEALNGNYYSVATFGLSAMGMFGVRSPLRFGSRPVPQPYWAINPQVRSDLENKGQALATATPPNETAVHRAVENQLARGMPVHLDPKIPGEVFRATALAKRALPEDMSFGVLELLEPTEKPGRAIANFRMWDGTVRRINYPLNLILESRAFVQRPGLNARPGVFFVRFNSPSGFEQSLVGELRHEAVHVLWMLDRLPTADRRRLSDHARDLRILNIGLNDFLTVVGRESGGAAANVPIGKVYRKLYAGRSDLEDLIEQEAVAHMVELASHGFLSQEELAPIQDILDNIVDGVYAGSDPDGGKYASPVPAKTLAALASDFDQIIARDRRILRQESGTLRSDGTVIPGRISSATRRSVPGWRDAGAVQPVGTTEQFDIPGYVGQVTASPIGPEETRRGARLIYDLSSNKGQQLGFAKIAQHADGAWEVENVEIQPEAQRLGLATKLYRAIEKDLGIRMSPSGVLEPGGYAFWQKRSPESVQWHQRMGPWYVSPRWLTDQLTLSGQAIASFQRMVDAKVPGAEEDLAAEKARRAKLMKAVNELSPEAKAARPSMFALRSIDKDGKPIQDDPAFKRWFRDSKVVDADGNPLIVYHGGQRIDRIAERKFFDPKRATSGPMSFFTDDSEIASNYGLNKSDTSMVDEGHTPDYFTVSPKDLGRPRERRPYTVEQSWHTLTPEQKSTILDRATRVGYRDIDMASGPFVLHPEGTDATLSRDHYDWLMRTSARGNPLTALREMWHDGGDLIGSETELATIYKLAGYPHPINQTTAPWYRAGGVIPAYLSLQNPLYTDDMGAIGKVIERLEQAFKRDRTKSMAEGRDMWDKNSRWSPKDWTADLKRDMAEKTNSYVWTSIPDKVTDVLKQMGYDGIIDTGAKGVALKLDDKSEGHTVYIPFYSTQIKSVFNRGTFEEGNPDILQAFAGQKAKGADLTALERAKAMSDDGRMINEIAERTGWHLGADGNWKFEIDDSKLKLKMSVEDMKQALEEPRLFALNEVIDHPELLRQYPQLAKIKVEFTYEKGGADASFEPAQSIEHEGEMMRTRSALLSINVAAFDPGILTRLDEALGLDPNPLSLENVILHELQHAIQSIEDFAGGANVEAASDWFLDRIVNGRLTPSDRALAKEHNLDKAVAYLEERKPILSHVVAIRTGQMPESLPMPMLAERGNVRRIVSRIDDKLGFELYQRSAGEAESRLVEARRKMTAAERRANFPELDRPDEELNFTFQGQGHYGEDNPGVYSVTPIRPGMPIPSPENGNTAPVDAYIGHSLDLSTDQSVTQETLYRDYEGWAASEGMRPMAPGEFGLALRRAGISPHKIAGKIRYLVALRGATPDKENGLIGKLFARAKQLMGKGGVPKETIKAQTGCYLDDNGEWKFQMTEAAKQVISGKPKKPSDK